MISKQGRTVEAVCAIVIEGEVPVLYLERKWYIIYLASGAHSGGKQKLQLCLSLHNQAVGFSEKGLWAATGLGKGVLNLVA